LCEKIFKLSFIPHGFEKISFIFIF